MISLVVVLSRSARLSTDLLSVGRSTVYEVTAAGELDVVHIGRCARIPVAAVEKFIERKPASAGSNGDTRPRESADALPYSARSRW